LQLVLLFVIIVFSVIELTRPMYDVRILRRGSLTTVNDKNFFSRSCQLKPGPNQV